MNTEQKLTLIYMAFGIGAGFLSKFLGVLLPAMMVPIALYIGSFFLLKKKIKTRSSKWLLTNSVITYALVWQVTWIMLFNYGGLDNVF
jgi:hypothetical protein